MNHSYRTLLIGFLFIALSGNIYGQCPAGQYKPTPASPCTPCPAGSYCPGDDNAYPCAAGSYQPSTGQSSCTLCPSGTYQSSTGQTFCFDCPPSAVGAPPGAVSLTDCFRILPVSLVYFKASLNNKQVSLAWATATETNNDRFVIERNVSGTAYASIGTVKGVGNSSSLVMYHFTDVAPATGLNHYRLKQIDVDGTVKISEVRTIDPRTRNEITFYTEPTSGNIVLQKNHARAARMRIYSGAGQLVYKADVNQNRTVISVSNWPKGLYTAVIESDGKSETRKFTW